MYSILLGTGTAFQQSLYMRGLNQERRTRDEWEGLRSRGLVFLPSHNNSGVSANQEESTKEREDVTGQWAGAGKVWPSTLKFDRTTGPFLKIDR